jgi:hypothetical protein
LLTAVAAGDFTLSEAADIGKLVDSHLQSIEATDFGQRLAKIEKGITMKSSLRTLKRVERRKRVAAKVRPWTTDGSSEEDGAWRGSYFIKRMPMSEDDWIAKFVPPG